MFYLLHFWRLYIWWNQHNTVCAILVKVDVLNKCGPMTCLYFGIAFMIFVIKIENAVYTSFQNSTLLFINRLIFDIMNIQNNQSLEFEWIPMLAPLRSVNDWRFSWLSKVFDKFFQDIWILFSNAKETLQKMLAQKMFISTLTDIGQINWIFL